MLPFHFFAANFLSGQTALTGTLLSAISVLTASPDLPGTWQAFCVDSPSRNNCVFKETNPLSYTVLFLLLFLCIITSQSLFRGLPHHLLHLRARMSISDRQDSSSLIILCICIPDVWSIPPNLHFPVKSHFWLRLPIYSPPYSSMQKFSRASD